MGRARQDGGSSGRKSAQCSVVCEGHTDHIGQCKFFSLTTSCGIWRLQTLEKVGQGYPRNHYPLLHPQPHFNLDFRWQLSPLYRQPFLLGRKVAPVPGWRHTLDHWSSRAETSRNRTGCGANKRIQALRWITVRPQAGCSRQGEMHPVGQILEKK